MDSITAILVSVRSIAIKAIVLVQLVNRYKSRVCLYDLARRRIIELGICIDCDV